MKTRSLLFSAALGLASVTAVATTAACAPQTAVAPLVQRTACSTTDAPHTDAACTHWVNRLPAWGYPADTEWFGPWSDYLWDNGHNGAELVP